MNYSYKVFYHNDKDSNESGTGNLNDLSRPIREDVLRLVASLEKEYYNKHIRISVDTEDFQISLISGQKI